MRSFLVRAAVLLAGGWYAAAQSPVISLHVVATDKQGQLVTDLKAEDFHVLDDGKPQPIVLFRAYDNRRPTPTALGKNEYSNWRPETPRGATIILFDLLNGAFTEREYIVGTLVKALANVEFPNKIFLYLLTNDGTLFPVHPLPEPGAEPAPPEENWTRQAKLLLDAAIQKVYGFRPVEDRDVGVRAVTTANVLHSLGGDLAALPGRKNVVWVTNGFPLQVNFGGLCHNLVVLNVTAPCSGIYVDFTAVVRHLGAELNTDGISLYPADEWSVEGGERVLVKSTLEIFAGMTAGRSYASGGTKAAITEAVQATHFTYTLGYLPAPKTWDGKYHKLRVTSVRKGIEIQSEQGYLATAPVDETGALMQAAATGNSDLPEIGLRATVTPGANPQTAHIQLRVDSSSVAFVQQNGRYAGQLAVLYAGLTAQGPKQLAKPESLNFDWTAPQYEAASKEGIPIAADLPASAALHQVRIVVVDTKSNRAGSLTVPMP
jgi:VWFA-related protein